MVVCMAMNRLVHSAQFHLTSCHKFCEVEAAQQCLIGGSLLLSAGPQSKFLDRLQCVNFLYQVRVLNLTCILRMRSDVSNINLFIGTTWLFVRQEVYSKRHACAL